MIDIHSHIVFDVDDGPKTREDTRALLEESYRQGVRTIISTSHPVSYTHLLFLFVKKGLGWSLHRVKRIGILVERKKEDAVTFRKLRLLMSKYGFSILFMGFELWASFAAFFWLNRWFPHWLSVAVIGLLYVSTILARCV